MTTVIGSLCRGKEVFLRRSEGTSFHANSFYGALIYLGHCFRACELIGSPVMIEKLRKFTDIRCCLVVGGLSTKVRLCPKKELALFQTMLFSATMTERS
ncbi:hypothetical protein D5086_011626 [Populus alba]|uniref:Uncharacterized protein n=1 Tax=Populus alba TaxID=43335 RepID=A0ACC4CEI5_POPAL